MTFVEALTALQAKGQCVYLPLDSPNYADLDGSPRWLSIENGAPKLDGERVDLIDTKSDKWVAI